MFLYQIANLPSYQQSDGIQYPIRRSGTVFIKVPRERMSVEIQRITRMGGKIISIEPLYTAQVNPPSVPETVKTADTAQVNQPSVPETVKVADTAQVNPPSVPETAEVANTVQVNPPSVPETVKTADTAQVNQTENKPPTPPEDLSKKEPIAPPTVPETVKVPQDDRPQLILAWWLEATIEDISRTHYFGPFDSVEDALSSQSECVKNLFNEGARGISLQVKYCKPQKLIVYQT